MIRSFRRLRGIRLIYLGIIILFIYFVLIKGNILFAIVGGMRHLVGNPSDGGLTAEQASELRTRNDELEMKNLSLSEKNFHLRKVLALDDAAGRYGFPYELAKAVEADVIYTDHGAVYQSALLDVGSSDGISKDDPVVGAKGLVGRVVNVHRNYCNIVLLPNPDCKFGAVVRGTLEEPRGTRELGLVVGDGKRVMMTYLGKQADVRVGDLVVTSGQSGLTPSGILIGEVDQVEALENELMLKVTITPATDFNDLDSVIVLKYGSSLKGGL